MAYASATRPPDRHIASLGKFAGAFLGGAGAYGVSRLLISLIPSLPTRDPLILPIAGSALVLVALLACYIPARRATRVDPLVALRSE